MKCQQISCLKELPGQPQPRYRMCAVTDPIWRRELWKGLLRATQAEIQNDDGSLGLLVSLKTRFRLSHLIKRESSMFSLRQYCLDFPIFTMIDSKFYFSLTFTSNLFFWTRNKNDICLKHMKSSTLFKCNSMIILIVMPSYPNITLFVCCIGEHWTIARTLNVTINHKIP